MEAEAEVEAVEATEEGGAVVAGWMSIEGNHSTPVHPPPLRLVCTLLGLPMSRTHCFSQNTCLDTLLLLVVSQKQN